VSANTLKLNGMVASVDGVHILRATEDGSASTPEQVGKRLAQKIAEMGALAFITATKEPSQS